MIESLRAQLNRILGLRIVRYVLSAGTATVADVLVFAGLIYLVLERDEYVVGPLRFNTHDWALIFSYTTGVIVHFLGSKLFVFNESTAQTQVQFSRFLIVAVVVYFANRLLLDWLLEVFIGQWPATDKKLLEVTARAIAIVSVGMASFLTHKYFTFRDSEASPEA